MNIKYEGMITNDISKKRKKWKDVIIDINTNKRHLLVKDEDGKSIFSSSIDTKLYKTMFDGEEVRLSSSFLFILGDRINNNQNQSINQIQPSPSSSSSHLQSINQNSDNSLIDPQSKPLMSSIKKSNSILTNNNNNNNNQISKSLIKQFKVPSQSSNNLKQYIPPSINSNKSSNIRKISDDNDNNYDDNINNQFNTPTQSISIMNKSPSLSSTKYSPSSSSSSSSSKYSSSNQSSIQNNYSTFNICPQYEEPFRRSLINKTFINILEYVKQFKLALAEEMLLNIASNMQRFEKKLLKEFNLDNIDGINKFRFSFNLSLQSINSNNNNNNSQQQIQRKKIGFQMPNIEKIHDKLRSVAIPFAIHIDVIISPPKPDEEENRKNNYNYNIKKRKTIDIDDDENDNKDNDISNETTKIYLKFQSASKDCPKGCESYGKGDIWMLWKDSDIYTPQQVINNFIKSGDLPSELNLESNQIYFDRIKIIRDKFIIDRSNSGYPFPFYGGITFQDTWLVKSNWYNVSDQGMLEISNIDGDFNIPTNMGKLPSGKARGALDKKFSGLRISTELTSLLAFDLLLNGEKILNKGNNNKLITNADNPFNNLINSPAFINIVDNKFSKMIKFPSLSIEGINTIIDEIITEFRLNIDQIEVLKRVGSWFNNSSK
jgi:hypothetical protein